MHRLLARQLKRVFRGKVPQDPEFKELLELVDRTYSNADDDRELIERSLEISSRELGEKNNKLRLELNRVRAGKEEIAKLAELRRLAEGRARELERANRVMVGREIQMIELKKKNQRLEKAADRRKKTSSRAA